MDLDATDQARLRDLLDKQEIHEALLRYCRAIDRRDIEAMESVFHPDAYEDHGAYKGDRNGFVAAVASSWETGTAPVNPGESICGQHMIGQHLIELEGDVAYSEAYLLAVARFKHDTELEDVTSGARYITRWERRDDGAWKIARRAAVLEWTRVEPVTPRSDAGVYMQPGRWPDDPVYRDTNRWLMEGAPGVSSR